MERVGVDVGGTFTDLVGVLDGKLLTRKTLSTRKNPAVGVGTALQQMVSGEPEFARQLDKIHHGTTVATNALLEGETAETALITTAGFRDVLEIGRQVRPDLYDLNFSRPSPIVPRNLRFTVSERLAPGGRVIRALDEEELRKVVKKIPDTVSIVAVSTLFSFVNPIHEQKIKKYLLNHGFQDVVLSSEVLPEFREYERTSTTVLNASLRPVLRKYLTQLEKRAKDLEIDARWFVMQSNGGVIDPNIAERQPVRTILSGPAGGVKGSQFIARSAGYEDVLTFDMGGTSADVCLIKDGEPAVSSDWSIEGHPVGVSSLDVHTIGAGGGSIAWIDEGGVLKVGPQSAGACPGPASYLKGGNQPTVTDAHLVLGRLDPAFPLADGLQLDKRVAREVLEREIARPLGLSLSEAAQGILDVANSNMKQALRLVSVQQGHDPRSFVLLAYGGAGPLHATRLAKEMSIPRVIIPPAAGVLSALGLLTSNIRREFVSSVLKLLGDLEAEELEGRYSEFVQKVSESIDDRTRLHPFLHMRYQGQSYDLRVPLSTVKVNGQDLKQARGMFDRLHRQKYGHARPDEPVEVVNQRLVIVRETEDVKISRGSRGGKGPAHLGSRMVTFPSGERETDVYRFESLKVDEPLVGPAVVHSADSTITILPDQQGKLNHDGAMLIEV
ncbi:MAG: hydantoinase/oxoprolinase family protein [Candidatus Acetothermia bacterium]